MANNLQLLIFDLDGVITSEQRYWNTARLTVWQLLCDPNYLNLGDYFNLGAIEPSQVLAAGEQVIDVDFITNLKNRAVNSNWDLTFFVLALHLIGVLAQVKIDGGALPASLGEIGQVLGTKSLHYQGSQQMMQSFWRSTQNLKGGAVQEYLPTFAQEMLGTVPKVLADRGQLWQLCYENFQAWYEGRYGYLLPDDETVLPVAAIREVLERLAQKYRLGVATGRPRRETLEPLAALGLLEFFDPQRIVTYDEVLQAEATRPEVKLGKPHPFIVLKAIYPDLGDSDLLGCQAEHLQVAYVGDAASDVAAALGAKCRSIGVLTGFGVDRAYKEQLLTQMGCQQIVSSILELPELLN
jgi:phosphoglycolate phosphatase-like HAD superfamily hydrolase